MHRALLDWEWYDDHQTTRLWIHILLSANWKDKNWRGKLIKRGSFITSLDHLSKGSGLSVKQVRRCLDNLIKTKEVGKQTTSAYTLITVLSYNDYQEKGKPKDKQRASEGQTKGKQRATTKEREEREEGKEREEYIKRERFLKPSKNDLSLFFQSKGESLTWAEAEAEKFLNFYESKDWYIGKNKMRKWKSAAAGWYNRNNEKRNSKDYHEGSIVDALAKAGH